MSLLTLSNQDRELQEEVVLFACDSKILLFTGNGGTRKATHSSTLGEGLYNQRGQEKKTQRGETDRKLAFL